MDKTELKTEPEKAQDIIFIGSFCFDLLMSAAGILAKKGQSLQIIDASSTGELFDIVASYGGRTNKIVTFRQADYILCGSAEGLERLVFSEYRENDSARKDNSSGTRWFYIDPDSWNGKPGHILKEKKCKKIILADSFYHSMKPLLSVVTQKNFQADLFILRGVPGKKITFSYFYKTYKKEFRSLKKILELPWREEDFEYRVRLGYEPSQGFARLSEGYQNAVEEICMEAGGYKKTELYKVFHTFEKNER